MAPRLTRSVAPRGAAVLESATVERAINNVPSFGIDRVRDVHTSIRSRQVRGSSRISNGYSLDQFPARMLGSVEVQHVSFNSDVEQPDG